MYTLVIQKSITIQEDAAAEAAGGGARTKGEKGGTGKAAGKGKKVVKKGGDDIPLGELETQVATTLYEPTAQACCLPRMKRGLACRPAELCWVVQAAG